MDYTKLIIFCLIVIIIYLMLSNRKKKKNNKNKNIYTNITTTQNVNFSIPPNNMICSYFFDMEVFFSNSSKVNHIILDRISPIIKLNMSSGAIIIEYLSSKKIDSSNNEKLDVSNNVDLSNNGIEKYTQDTSEDSECTCPNPGKKSNNIFSNNDNSITYPTLLRVVTPEIPFQKANHIEIRQNLRVIQIFLNGKFFYSTLLDYVPYLYKGNAIILPNESWRSINLKKIEFKAL